MSSISIITTQNKRLYPAKVYDRENNQLVGLIVEVDDIYNLLYKMKNILVISNQYDQNGLELEVFHGYLEKSDIKALFAVNDDDDIKDLSSVMTLSEAAKKWGLADGSTIRKAIERGKFQQNEIRQAGDVWITTYSAMERVFGQVKSEDKDYIIYDDFEVYMIKVCYNDAQLDYLRGKQYKQKLKESDVAYEQIKEIFVKALDTIKNKNKVIIKKTRNDNIRQVISTENELYIYIRFLGRRHMTVKRNNQLIDDLYKLMVPN